MSLLDRLRYDKEERQAMLWTRVAMFIVVVFLASFAFSCSEMRYSIWGEKAQATVSRVAPAPAAGRNQVTVFYDFTDAKGAKHSAKYTDGELAVIKLVTDGTFEVIYYPGYPEESAKPVATRRWWAVAVFLGMSGLLAGWILVYSLKVKRETGGHRRRR
jgi:hypothetical protein